LEFDAGLEVYCDDAVWTFSEVVVEDFFCNVKEIEFVVTEGNVNIKSKIFLILQKKFFIKFQSLFWINSWKIQII